MINKSSVICIDLDDTIYSEFEFFKSGVKHSFAHFLNEELKDDSLFLQLNSNWIEHITEKSCVYKNEVLNFYRNHIPRLKLPIESEWFLNKIKKYSLPIVLITDGRSITQRNKLSALGILDYFNLIVISEEFGSEKPCIDSFKKVMNFFDENYNFIYIGDNTNKDFIGPNQLSWLTICLLDKGNNIHKQDFNKESRFLPTYTINSFKQINFNL